MMTPVSSSDFSRTALSSRCAARHTVRAVTSPESHPLSERLRLALDEAGLSNRKLARLMAGPDASTQEVENERRKLQRYLADDGAPQRSTALRMAELLGKPPDYFIDARPLKEELARQIAELRMVILEAIRLGQEQAEAVEVAGVEQDLVLRLEALEGTVAKSGKETATALRGVARRLGRIEEALGRPELERARRAR